MVYSTKEYSKVKKGGTKVVNIKKKAQPGKTRPDLNLFYMLVLL